MELHKRRKTPRSNKTKGASDAFCLTFYIYPPDEEVTLDEFRQFALLRLKTLRTIESEKGKGKNREEIDAALEKDDIKNDSDLNIENSTSNNNIKGKIRLSSRRVDLLSHFVLRLAYCQSEALRQQFLMVESELFRFRFQRATPGQQKIFFEENNLDFQPISEEERKEMPNWVPPNTDLHEGFYKIPFEEAIKLVMRRQVYVQDGYVYCPEHLLFEIIVGRFRSRLARELAVAYRSTQNQVRDKRIHPWLFQLVNQYLGPKVKAAFGGAVTPQQIPQLARSSFPLCMRNSYEHLKEDHHLKNGGRMHFGLFLKGIGLSLPDSLMFWKNSFSPRTPPQKFEKSYAYTFKHQYGAVGQKTDYTPFGCAKIINHISGPADHCGCPYKNFDDDHLVVYLRKNKISEGGIREIIDLKKGHHYQIACQKYFQLTHPGAIPSDVGNHPNSYFQESLEFHSRKEEEENVETQNPPSQPFVLKSPSPSSSSSSSSSHVAQQQPNQQNPNIDDPPESHKMDTSE